jgi:hypothetical protein
MAEPLRPPEDCVRLAAGLFHDACKVWLSG